MKKKVIAAVVVPLTLSAALGYVIFNKYQTAERKNNAASISTYRECVNEGYPVQESYPSVCKVTGGESFINPAEVAVPPPKD